MPVLDPALLFDAAGAAAAVTAASIGAASVAALATTNTNVATNTTNIATKVNATQAAAVAPVQSVNGMTGAVTVVGGTGGGGGLIPVATKTVAYTANASELVPSNTTTAAFTVFLPVLPAIGATVGVYKTDASVNMLTIAPASGGTINGDPTATTVTRNAGATFEHLGTNVWTIVANYLTTGQAGPTGATGPAGAAATNPVTSVAGRIGAVVLATGDVSGLGTAAVANKVAAGVAGVLDATDATTTNSRVPSGAAAGGLGGTYPSPSVTVVAAGAVGPLSATDASTTNVRTPTGAASGGLGGTYPNPSVTVVAAGAVGPLSATDASTTNARTPTAHAGTHAAAGADFINPTEQVNLVTVSGTAQTLPDVTAATVHRITLTAACTFTFPAAVSGKSFTMILTQDATGGRLVTWPASVVWSGGTAPTLTVTAAKRDILSFLSDGTSFFGFVAGLAF